MWILIDSFPMVITNLITMFTTSYTLLKKKCTFNSSIFLDDPGSGSVTLGHAQLFKAPRSNTQKTPSKNIKRLSQYTQ